MAPKIADVLEILGDGKWHTRTEIQRKLGIDEDQIQRITEFLTKYEFIVLDKENTKIRLDNDAKKFLTNTATV